MPNIKQNDESQSYENRQQSGHGQEHMTKSGEPDHRYKENRDDQNQQSSNHGQEQHMTKSGEPDHRYKENREDQGRQQRQNDNDDDDDENDQSSKLSDIPTKKDGTADMRYAESREAIASGLISKDENIEEAMHGGHHEQ